LVLGAGVSVPNKIPNWNELAKKLWAKAFPNSASPWKIKNKAKSPQNLPQFLPIVYELAYQEVGEDKFMDILEECMYENAILPNKSEIETSIDTLPVLARVINREFKVKENRRLLRVITFNTDDLLENIVWTIRSKKGNPIKVIVRSSDQPTEYFGERKANRIPVYHLHGFIPSKGSGWLYELKKDSAEHLLVFTDAQYWQSSGTPLSHANRIMTNALFDSHCIFIGLSMTDINLLRWLALRTLEIENDARELKIIKEKQDSKKGYGRYRMKLMRHYWLRPDSDDSKGLLSDFLRHRGVFSVKLKRWGSKDFSNLMDECFPVEKSDNGTK
jgi:hypothetical protein